MLLVKLKSIAAKLAVLAASMIVAVILAEIALRSFGISYPMPYVPDPYCGSRLDPGMQALYTKEGRAWVSINSHGNRDRERSFAKAPGTYRIVVLGDSYAEAMQVEQEQAFWSVLEKQLGSCEKLQNRKVEVLNFGVSGYGTAQELEMLKNYVWQYEPDLVLLAFLTGNDIGDNSKQLSPNEVRPYYVHSVEGDLSSPLVLDKSFQQHPHYLIAQTTYSKVKVNLINRSRLLQILRQVWADYRNRDNTPKPQPEIDDTGLDPIYAPPKDKVWQQAWSITEQLLLMTRDEVKSHGADFCVVTLSNGIQVYPVAEVRRSTMKSWGVDDLMYPDKRIADLGARENFKVITLAPKLQEYAEKKRSYLHGFPNTKPGTGHWNVEGHQAAGTFIANELCEFLGQDRNDSQSDPNLNSP
jgi:hypothetical protein